MRASSRRPRAPAGTRSGCISQRSRLSARGRRRLRRLRSASERRGHGSMEAHAWPNTDHKAARLHRQRQQDASHARTTAPRRERQQPYPAHRLPRQQRASTQQQATTLGRQHLIVSPLFMIRGTIMRGGLHKHGHMSRPRYLSSPFFQVRRRACILPACDEGQGTASEHPLC